MSDVTTMIESFLGDGGLALNEAAKASPVRTKVKMAKDLETRLLKPLKKELNCLGWTVPGAEIGFINKGGFTLDLKVSYPFHPEFPKDPKKVAGELEAAVKKALSTRGQMKMDVLSRYEKDRTASIDIAFWK